MLFFPAGYLYKKISTDVGWLRAGQVKRICSLSGCISQNHPLFDPSHFSASFASCPEEFAEAAALEGTEFDPTGFTLMYYTMYGREFDEELETWSDVAPEKWQERVAEPEKAVFIGYDAAVWQANIWGAGCSPLSCNYMANEIAVNEHCLFETLQEAVTALDSGLFKKSEPGPYGIFGVYEVEAVRPVNPL